VNTDENDKIVFANVYVVRRANERFLREESEGQWIVREQRRVGTIRTKMAGMRAAQTNSSQTGKTLAGGRGRYKLRSEQRNGRRTGRTKYFRMSQVAATRRNATPSNKIRIQLNCCPLERRLKRSRVGEIMLWDLFSFDPLTDIRHYLGEETSVEGSHLLATLASSNGEDGPRVMG
jgi:hypothetical protein